jgi:hypothetical protein
MWLPSFLRKETCGQPGALALSYLRPLSRCWQPMPAGGQSLFSQIAYAIGGGSVTPPRSNACLLSFCQRYSLLMRQR